jgi:carbamoyl-phosphate synthase large subunit
MRNASIAVLREIGVDTGGSNVQFAVNPEDGRLVIIEMNPRVSRSSALASKATGFPIAKVAAKLAVGYTLDELQNEITRTTPASFEPTIDYVVTKMPRFTFEKFPGADALLTTSMKSVGEAMAIGRSFAESVQKALRSMETGLTGFNEIEIAGALAGDKNAVRAALAKPTPDRLLVIAEAYRHGLSTAEIHDACKYDPWFLEEIRKIVEAEAAVRTHGLPEDAPGLLRLKGMGFSDARLAELVDAEEMEIAAKRTALGVHPVYKRIDTCAAEFPSLTPYMYSTYEGDGVSAPDCEADPSARDKVVILGGGPNRIGQGIEFDYCCVHAAYSLKEAGVETIMVNCNPETVSTDYDTSDRLYFEPLTLEDVLEIVEKEKPEGVIVQFGGQTPLKLARDLEKAGVPIIGTTPDAIDRAEDRERFQQMLNELGLLQPPNRTARTAQEALAGAKAIGYPVVVRPSYVLGGRAMEIVHAEADLVRYMNEAVKVSNDSPVLIDRFLNDAIEVDVDAVSDGERVIIGGIMEHIEQAGVHSGDSACSLPPFSLAPELQAELKRQTIAMAKALNVVGLMNVQFAIQDGKVYVLEVNPRASRTVPYVSKATGVPLAKVAARCMVGVSLERQGVTHEVIPPYYSVKEAVFPFIKFPGVDTILGPEMKSTGEVMGVGQSFAEAFVKSQLAAGVRLPKGGKAFLSVRNADKARVIEIARALDELGFSLVATRGTAAAIAQAGLKVQPVNKVQEGRPHIVDMLKNREVSFIVNTVEEDRRSIQDSWSIRNTALQNRITYYTTLAGARAACLGMRHLEEMRAYDIQSLHATLP